jgi:hypothetical protein
MNNLIVCHLQVGCDNYDCQCDICRRNDMAKHPKYDCYENKVIEKMGIGKEKYNG